MTPSRRSAPHLICLAAAVALLCMVGCNRKSEPPSASGGNTGGGGAATNNGTAAKPDNSTNRSVNRWEVRVDDDGNKWLGDVPYDVFFEDPLEVARDSEPIAVAASDDPPVTVPSGNTPDPTESSSSEPEAASASSWDTFISQEVLEAEVKSIRNDLNQKLQSVGSYNSGLAMIPYQVATLAAMALVASEHPAEISWKEDALYIRDLVGVMNAEPLQRGPKFQRPLLESFEKITDTLNRSRPSELEAPDPERPFEETAEMLLLMKRIQNAYDKMKTEAGSEESFKASADMVKHEAAIMSTLAKIVADKYDYADDEDFQAFAKPVIDAGAQISAAAQVGSFDEFDRVLSAAYKSCTQCHSAYNE